MRQYSTEEQQAQDLADRLVEYALACMFKKNKVSPFECLFLFRSYVSGIFTLNTDNATREGLYYRGGVSHKVFSL